MSNKKLTELPDSPAKEIATTAHLKGKQVVDNLPFKTPTVILLGLCQMIYELQERVDTLETIKRENSLIMDNKIYTSEELTLKVEDCKGGLSPEGIIEFNRVSDEEDNKLWDEILSEKKINDNRLLKMGYLKK